MEKGNDMEQFDWNNLSYEEPLSEAFLLEHQNKLDWELVFEKQPLSLETIQYLYEQSFPIQWDKLSKNKYLTEDVMDAFKEHLNWNLISSFVPLQESYILKQKDWINWNRIITRQKLSLSFLQLLQKQGQEFSFFDLSFNTQLSDEIIEYYRNELNWEILSACVPLSETIMNRLPHKVKWISIAIEQDISFEFAKKHIKNMRVNDLKNNKKQKFTTEQLEILEKCKRSVS